MLASCIARSKKHQQQGGGDELPHAPKNHSSIKSLTLQVRDMALKASGSYRHCHTSCTVVAPQAHKQLLHPQERSNSDRFKWSLSRSGSLNSSSSTQWGKEMEARLKGISFSSGKSIQRSFSSGRKLDVPPVVFVPENEPKEWVALVEPGVLVDFVSLPKGGNDLKRIRFSREMYSKLQAQKWWIENCDRVAELYNVQKLNHRTFPVSTTPRSEDESVKIESVDSYSTASHKEGLTTHGLRISKGTGMDYPSDTSERHFYQGSSSLTSTPKLSSISGTKTETSSVDMSLRTSSSVEANQSDEMSLANASGLEKEWVEEDEPGVYITIRAPSNGTRELRRVRFSREKFGVVDAREWWESNRRRIRAQYLS